MTWILSGLSIITMWLMGNKSRWGPAIGIVSQELWFYYCITTHQYGLLLGAVFYLVIHIRNYILWTREAKNERSLR